ncbi:hypothetical protein OOT00_01925 [Desulfobotulus sp. H1]|uniref:DUF45 domain-containing protein n=1 Tax=Desulfobotulus pelophilus TaxID=2823377 RepID=A0ABT3N5J7_9BACT|nr:hypothetical protein [Desulfobotulus pelophilus]MCW7752741.1 hypothetical protein [Desulfobotulus pelophilus]
MHFSEHGELFSIDMLEILDLALPVAEESVAGFYKMSTSRWGRLRYDVRTAVDLLPHEQVGNAYAQVLRYVGMPWQRSTSAAAFTVYRICLQDSPILDRLRKSPFLELLPFLVYVLVHELVHVVRFSTHLQLFEALPEKRLQEERRVQEITGMIVGEISVPGLAPVCSFFSGPGGASVDLFEF